MILKPYLNTYSSCITVYILLLTGYTGKFFRNNQTIRIFRKKRMSSRGVLKRITKTVACVLALTLLLSCSSHGQPQDQISLSPNAKFEIEFSPNDSSLDIILKGTQQLKQSIF